MFIGHWAPALVAATHPKAPRLGTLFLAGQLVDWAFFAFVLTGTEHMRISPGTSVMNPMDLYHMPYTHSLLGSGVWAAGFATLIWLITKNRTGAVIGGVVVLSHWFLDLLVHVHDLTLWGSPPKLGFGLWNHPAIEMPLELGLTFGALFWFIMKTRSVGSMGRMAPAVLALLLLTIQIINWFGPPPEQPDASAAMVVFGTYGLMTLAAWWVSRARVLSQ
ncbi:MAG: hypothetical protein AABZ45_00610 [Pseudomonadota bacterium]